MSIVPVAPRAKIETQYPSSYFELHKTKPVLNITLTLPNLGNARNVIKRSIPEGKLVYEHVCTFLYYYLGEIQDTLNEEWISYQQRIGGVGDVITPLNLLDVQTTET